MARILIVDDQILNRQFLSALLGFDGHTLLLAADGVEALKIAGMEHPELVITDILMPHMSGYEFVTRLRADAAIAAIPVIFYTSTYNSREARTLARNCGVRWVLQKPALPETIIRAIHEALDLPSSHSSVFIPAVPPSAESEAVDVDDQVGDYLQELESSSQLITQLAAADCHAVEERDETVRASRHLSRSMFDLQSVSLRLTALIDMGIEMNVERDPRRLLETACRLARHIGVATYAVICIVDEDLCTVRHLVARGLAPAMRARLASSPAPGGVLAAVMRDKTARRMKTPDGNPQALGLPAFHPPVGSFLAVPIATSERRYGCLYLVDKIGADEFSEIDEHAASTVATQCAIAYENLALYQTIQKNVRQLELELIERKLVGDQLRDSETRFRQLAEHIHDVFFLIDSNTSETLYISPAYETIWGRSCESLYLRPASWMDAIHPDDLPTVIALETARHGEKGNEAGEFARQYRIVRPDGGIRHIHVRGFPIRDDAGAVYRIAGIATDNSEQKRLQASLREREAGLHRAQLVAKLAHVITGPDGAFESCSRTLPQLIGVDDTALPPTLRDWLALVDPADQALVRDTCIAAGKTGKRMEVAYRIRRGDGSSIRVRHVLEPLEGSVDPDGRQRWFNTIQDVSEQIEQQHKIARLSRIYAVLSGINAAIVRIRDRDELLQEACRVAVSQGAFTMAWAGVVDPLTLDGKVVGCYGGASGYTENIRFTARADDPNSVRPACVAARESRQVVCNDIDSEPSLAPLKEVLLKRGHRSLAILPLIVDKRTVAVLALFAGEVNFFARDDKMKLLDELAGDLSFGLQFIRKEERLDYLAYYDALTGLPNGTLFRDRLVQFLHTATGNKDLVAVMSINIDRFSHLNDTLGRHIGDAVLKMVAQRLCGALSEPYSLARVGGDTFALALGGVQRGADAATLLEQKIFAPLHEAMIVAQQVIRITVRAGIALFPTDGGDAETLIRRAEVALKKVKSSAERYLYYAPAMNAEVAARVALEGALSEALEMGQFEVHYQPRVDLLSGRIVSAEALIRWRHPLRGIVAPVEFIPLAEETGQIVAIGAWVIEAVCEQQARWKERQVAIVPVAINLSAVQFEKGDVQHTIGEALLRHGVAQADIEFELTESAVMGNPEEASRKLHALKAMGARLSLDDFGTGYSSLAYLKKFPFDFIKIDRAFITDITTDPDDAAIATAVIAMAHSLGKRVVAEGVETEGQLRFLRRQRCDELQGYYFSRPVPAPEFETMLREDKRITLEPEPAQREDTLLIVDDEPNNLSALRRLLRQEGYRVLTAGSGQEGLELLALNSVQVILADQRMPGMSGSKFLGLVSDLYPQTVRIILSGYTDLEAVTESVNQGAVFKFLTKPWNDVVLREHIREAFRRFYASV